jgi:hypothetical protein
VRSRHWNAPSRRQAGNQLRVPAAADRRLALGPT